MDRKSIRENIVHIIGKWIQDINKDNMQVNFSLIGLNSVEIMEIICLVEEHFLINFTYEDIDKVRSINDIVDIVSKYLEKNE